MVHACNPSAQEAEAKGTACCELKANLGYTGRASPVSGEDDNLLGLFWGLQGR